MTISITGQHAQELYHEDPINVAAAMAGMKEEKALGFKKTLVLYRKAALWSMCISLALVMEGYDVGIVSQATISIVHVILLWTDQLFLGTEFVP